jgi:hypothetical protein
MSGGSFARRWLVTALALVVPAGVAQAAAPASQAIASVNIVHPLSAAKLRDMDFGRVTALTAGTAVLEPNADAYSTTGGVTPVGGTPHCAQFVGSAKNSAVVNIKIPRQSITVTRIGGTQTMTVSNFTLQGQSKRSLAKAESFTFRVGATLNVAARQTPGTYVGTFDVTVQYP